tara:strand:+ start:820 stop:975 length:156 start_codon:yes stop_codon:yes gene_type:complete
MRPPFLHLKHLFDDAVGGFNPALAPKKQLKSVRIVRVANRSDTFNIRFSIP